MKHSHPWLDVGIKRQTLAASDMTQGRTLGNNGAVAVDFKPR